MGPPNFLPKLAWAAVSQRGFATCVGRGVTVSWHTAAWHAAMLLSRLDYQVEAGQASNRRDQSRLVSTAEGQEDKEDEGEEGEVSAGWAGSKPFGADQLVSVHRQLALCA